MQQLQTQSEIEREETEKYKVRCTKLNTSFTKVSVCAQCTGHRSGRGF